MHEVKSLDFEYTKAWKNYPEAFKRRLAERGLSMTELARQAGVPKITVSKILRGDADPFLSTARRLAYCLHMSLERFSEILEETQKNRGRQNGSDRGTLSSANVVLSQRPELVSNYELTPACSHAA